MGELIPKLMVQKESIQSKIPVYFKIPLKDESGKIRIFGTFLGKVPKYGYTVSPVRWDTYFLVNRVENQKLNQTTAELSFG